MLWTRLRHDRWCGDLPLKEAYPVLFECASNQDATIEDVLIHQAEGIEWDVTFIRNFNDWEVDIVASFLNLLYSQTLVGLGWMGGGGD